jgi:hypothetical protein
MSETDVSNRDPESGILLLWGGTQVALSCCASLPVLNLLLSLLCCCRRCCCCLLLLQTVFESLRGAYPAPAKQSGLTMVDTVGTQKEQSSW